MAEQRTFNPLVVGSTPTRGTIWNRCQVVEGIGLLIRQTNVSSWVRIPPVPPIKTHGSVTEWLMYLPLKQIYVGSIPTAPTRIFLKVFLSKMFLFLTL